MTARWVGRRTLDPALEAALNDALRAPLTPRGWLQRRPRARPDWPDAARLEAHRPDCAIAISHHLRSLLSTGWYAIEDKVGRGEGRGSLARATARYLWFRTVLESAPQAALLMSSDKDGHVREAAMDAVTRVAGHFGFTLLALRLDDWVEEVRLAASFALHRVFADLAARDALAELTPALPWLLERRDRVPARDPLNRAALIRILHHEALTGAAAQRFADSKGDAAPFLLRRALMAGYPVGDLDALARKAAHPAVRQIALSTALEGLFRWRGRERKIDWTGDHAALARAALDDASVEVRRTALRRIVRDPAHPAFSEDILRPLASHRDPRLAEVAIYGLRELGVDLSIAGKRARPRNKSGSMFDRPAESDRNPVRFCV